MSATLEFDARPTREGPFRRAEGWLDERGKGAWIAAMVVSFVLFWPIGLALLFFMLSTGRMGKGCTRHRSGAHDARHARFAAEWTNRAHGFRPSGNTAFDAYKAETLKRLMDEQEQFEAFLERLRAAKDKSEFDAFMDDRAEAARNGYDDDTDDAADADAEAEAEAGDEVIVQSEPKKK